MAQHERVWTKKFVIFMTAVLFVVISSANAKGIGNLTDSPAPCPPLVSWSACPDGAATCSTEQSCSGKKVCCASACGNVCVDPLLTSCEHYRHSAARRAKSLQGKTSGVSVRVPRCKSDGEWERIQCGPNGQGPCWCVDEGGAELPATRAPTKDLVNCTVPENRCPAHSCRMLCPLGFSLDAQSGCPRCECRDPCAGVICPGGQQCRLQEVACRTQPCPPVPTCKRARSLEELCPVGSPLSIADTRRPFLCGNDPGKPDCPPMYRCLVQRGNDYGVCCPASLQLRKPGSCPNGLDDLSALTSTDHQDCSASCQHDLQCPGETKCCHTRQCGNQCRQPENATSCHRQRLLSEILSVGEREGRGYIPQCDPQTGVFLRRQCSRNGLVCWCVQPGSGDKVKGTMGAAKDVNCPVLDDVKDRASGRSLTDISKCDKNICAAVCEYGFKDDENGCPTCECEEPCSGYKCPSGHSCEVARDAACEMSGGAKLCESVPVCRPDELYSNPCSTGVPLTQNNSTEPVLCGASGSGAQCPGQYECTPVPNEDKDVCCPATRMLAEDQETDRVQTMCEYLRDFSARMEGTVSGLSLALQPPSCDQDGGYQPVQCDQHNQTECWCVDRYGTELPNTRSSSSTLSSCSLLQESTPCLEVSCRMGCDYGFVLDETTGCPTCSCRDPCDNVKCAAGSSCQPVEVACVEGYCPPVPACLPSKPGQCPFLVPPPSGAGEDVCAVSCSSDDECAGETRCCSTGCGTRCMQPEIKTYCQHLQSVQMHRAHESGIPARMTYIAQCNRRNGSFEPVQCGRTAAASGAANACWCADERTGAEVPGTRTVNGTRPDCNAPSKICPDLQCSSSCEYGYKIASNGCQTCECIDPCEGVHCREHSETCRKVELTCSDGPCPPVGVCMPAADTPCDGAAPLTRAGVEVLCGPPRADACPSTHECRISPLQQKSVCCPKPRDVCFEPALHEGCPLSASGNVTRWRFNSQTNKCEPFNCAPDCPSNHNQFDTAQACRDVCPVLSQCERLLEKNERAAARYGKGTFRPKCDSETGAWSPAQCLGGLSGDEAGKEPAAAGLLCWCVDRKGVLLKGSLTRGAEPECNYRRARGRGREGLRDDAVLEELLRQLTSFNFVDSIEEAGSTLAPQRMYTVRNILAGRTAAGDVEITNRQLDIDIPIEDDVPTIPQASSSGGAIDDLLINPTAASNLERDNSLNNSHRKKMLVQPKPTPKTRCEGLRDAHQASYPVACDARGAFTPLQCNGALCWCVDEAGNQLPGSRTFSRNEKTCVPTPISAVEVVLGINGEMHQDLPDQLTRQLTTLVETLGGSLRPHESSSALDQGQGSVRFHIEGENKVDVAYRLEEMVKTQQLTLPGENPMLVDVTRTRFMHRIAETPTAAESLTAPPSLLEQQLLLGTAAAGVSSSSLDGVTPLQTAVFVLATASAFLVGVFVVFVMLHRGQKAKNMERYQEKADLGDRFLAYGGPLYTVTSTDLKAEGH